MKILIVDDDKISLLLYELIFNKLGMKIDEHFIVTKDGCDAIRLFKENEISFVILDLRLPGCDGYQVASQISKIKKIPIIMISGSCYESNKQKAYDSGCTDFLCKPFTPDVFLEAIQKL